MRVAYNSSWMIIVSFLVLHLVCFQNARKASAFSPSSSTVGLLQLSLPTKDCNNNRCRINAAAGAAGGEGQEDGLDGGSLDDTALYPQSEMIDSGFIKVSDVHTIHYEQYGNIESGKPVLFVHGGPGGGTSPENSRYFDPKSYRIVLVDQRGCGRSKPFACLEDNTTWDLISDFEKVRKHLEINEWMIFGGSWGSTLGLSYAISHPSKVTELVLRGIFLLRRKELDFFYEGKGTNFLFPAEWNDFVSEIPQEELDDANGSFIVAYGRRLRGEKGDDAKASAAKSWSVWEGSTSKLVVPSKENILNKWADDDFSLAFARIENHYFTSGGTVDYDNKNDNDTTAAPGFFPKDGWILDDENLTKIANIPTVIVQGRYDVVCPATSAYELHTKLLKLKKQQQKDQLIRQDLHIVTTGHSSFEPDIIEKLVEATDSFR